MPRQVLDRQLDKEPYRFLLCVLLAFHLSVIDFSITKSHCTGRTTEKRAVAKRPAEAIDLSDEVGVNSTKP